LHDEEVMGGTFPKLEELKHIKFDNNHVKVHKMWKQIYLTKFDCCHITKKEKNILSLGQLYKTIHFLQQW